MKTLFQISWKLASVSLLLFVCAAITASTAKAQTARLQLSQLDYLANKASETVDVNIDEHLMQTTIKLFAGHDKDDVEIKELLKGVKGIYVKSFTFEKEGEYSQTEINSVLSQLHGGGWSKIVGVTSKKDRENVDVYLMLVGDEIGGLVVISADPKELTVVNIVGPIDLSKLSRLEGQFGVPELNIDQPKKKQ